MTFEFLQVRRPAAPASLAASAQSADILAQLANASLALAYQVQAGIGASVQSFEELVTFQDTLKVVISGVRKGADTSVRLRIMEKDNDQWIPIEEFDLLSESTHRVTHQRGKARVQIVKTGSLVDLYFSMDRTPDEQVDFLNDSLGLIVLASAGLTSCLVSGRQDGQRLFQYMLCEAPPGAPRPE